MFLVSIALLLPITLSAHPGHGVGNGTDGFHYMASPVHVGIGLLALLLIGVGVAYYKRKKNLL